MKTTLSILTLILLFAHSTKSQEVNNLVHTADYVTGEWGKLGSIKEFGSGDKPMILLPGWGFDWTIFEALISKYENEYKIYAVTFPGFGNTAAPAMPIEDAEYSKTNWTNGIIKGIKELMDEKDIEKATIVSYFTYSNIIATRLALDNPDKVDRIIVISGMAKFTSNIISYEPSTLPQRVYYIEKVLGPQWFKTVSKETWDSGNFHPEVFTSDSTLAKKYWDQMSAVPIPTMVRYLCEYYCTDLSLEYSQLKVPMLVVVPAFTDDVLYKKETSYAVPFFHSSWLGAKPASTLISIVTINDSNAFIIDDQPAKLFGVMDEFLQGKLNPFQVVR